MNVVKRILLFLVIVSLFMFILMTSIRIFLTSIWLDIEYKWLNLPEDPYGMSTNERLDFSKATMEFLVGGSNLDELRSEKYEEGTTLFIDREISHLVDVKILIQTMIISWIIIGVYLVGMRFAFYYWKDQNRFWKSISAGGWTAVGVTVAIVLGVIINFDNLFTMFHEVFFTGDTWLFYTTDSLIRMFPMEFFANYFIAIGIVTILLGTIFGLLGSLYSKKSA